VTQWITIKAVAAPSTTGQSDLDIAYQESPAGDKARVVVHGQPGHVMNPVDVKWLFNGNVTDWYERETGNPPPPNRLIT